MKYEDIHIGCKYKVKYKGRVLEGEIIKKYKVFGFFERCKIELTEHIFIFGHYTGSYEVVKSIAIKNVLV